MLGSQLSTSLLMVTPFGYWNWMVNLSYQRKSPTFLSMQASASTLLSAVFVVRELFVILGEAHAQYHIIAKTSFCIPHLILSHSLPLCISSGPNSVWIRSEMNQDVFGYGSDTSGALAILTYTDMYAKYVSTSDPITGSSGSHSVNDP